ncbi:MAG: beta-lactamase family protein [Acidobacteria bacterium]|nr:beta-lactamase family protein [Acidobacteriota bacterium]
MKVSTKTLLPMRCLWISPFILMVGCFQPQQVAWPEIPEKGIAQIDQLLQDAVDRKDIPGVVAIVANRDRILYHQSFGKMDVMNGVEMQKDTIFGIASMTKPITSVAVMMLYEEGRLDLDDPISQYLDWLSNPEVIISFDEEDGTYSTKPAEREITIRHLLTFTAGFGYSFANSLMALLVEKTGKTERELPLLHEPGEKWTYGMEVRVLGELVEELSGRTLPQFLKERIFDPLGMSDTFYVLPAEKYPRWVTRHQRENGILRERPNPEKQRPFIVGDAGLLSTAPDYVRFLQMLLSGGRFNGNRILSEASIRLMTQNQIGELVVEIQRGPYPLLSRAFPLGARRGDKFGLGFQIAVADGKEGHLRSPGSYSWSGLSNTHFWVDPEKGIVAVILMQVLPFYDETCIAVYQGFEELIYEHLN